MLTSTYHSITALQRLLLADSLNFLPPIRPAIDIIVRVYVPCNDRLNTSLRDDRRHPSRPIDCHCSGSGDLMPPLQTSLPLSKQELCRRRGRRCSSASSGGATGDGCEMQEHPLPPLPPQTLYRTLRRCRPCAQDDAFASFDTGREAILGVGCTSTQTFTSNSTTTTSTKKTTSSINQSRKTTSNTDYHHHHSSPAWHADCSR